MTSQRSFDDRVLTQYLLGGLPDEDAERVDELSVTDDDVAWQLRAVENDLVDAYVRGELSGDTLAKFCSSYLANPERRRRVEIANALRTTGTAAPRHAWPVLAWAAALLVVAIGIGYFVIANRTHERPGPVEALNRVATPQHVVPTVSLLLLPPARGVAAMPVLRVPSADAHVIVRLQLESDDFPEYAVALRDLASNRTIFTTEHLKAGANVVSVDLAASSLKDQDYSLELSGVPAAGAAEAIGSYPFRVTR